ncbi:MAG: hypothetical protein M3P39_00250, partial [Actinomycetota bacterium]|nr:hypothetical protein [Actinomycetota bacterium]
MDATHVTRSLLTALALVLALALALGASTLPALADPRVVVVTLADGQELRVEVDAPADTPADQVPLPPLEAPVVAVQDAAAPPPTPAPPTPAPAAEP